MTKKLEKWQIGDMKAFEALFLEFKGLVFKNAIFMTGNRVEAEDILQEVFIKVWRSRHDFNPEKGKFVTWLYKITLNQCISNHRKKRPDSLSLDDELLSLSDSIKTDFIEENLINKMEYEKLMRELNQLDNKHKQVLILRYFNDLSYSEIAEILEIPLGTVKSRIFIAVRLLRERMQMEMKYNCVDTGRML
ncbi:MAG: RNA polymerase sigma factor [Dehalococcoidales bacterium]|nr:RNA polymerase sigma factor [Dehalococcoidales bacterium]